MKPLATLIAICGLALGVVACGDDDDAATASPTVSVTQAPTDDATPTVRPTSTPGTTTPGDVDCSANFAGPAATGDLTWAAILPENPPAPPGWTIEDAEGDAPLVAVVKDGQPVGTLELFQSAHADTFDPERGYAALEQFVQEFYASIQADREAAGGVWLEDDPEPTPFGDFCGIKYGFTVQDQTGAIIERSALAATFDASKLYLTSAFYDAATAGEGGFMDLESQQEFEPYFYDFVAALNVPAD